MSVEKWTKENSLETVLGLIKRAKKLIDTEDKWIKDNAAQDADGVECFPTKRKACKWCVSGALWKAAWLAKYISNPHACLPDEDVIKVSSIMTFMSDNIDSEYLFGEDDIDKLYLLDPIVNFNDHSQTEHSQMMEVFDERIGYLQEVIDASVQ